MATFFDKARERAESAAASAAQQARSPLASQSSLSGPPNPITSSPPIQHRRLSQSHDEAAVSVPPAPTVAETGLVPPSTGGPKSGTLRPRRSSSLARSHSITAGAVAYLGPAGTYTYSAAVQVFGRDVASLIPMQSISGVVDFVKRGTPGNPKFAVVPLENSTFGCVKETVDGLCDLAGSERTAANKSGGRAFVIAETDLSIQHALLCGPKTYQYLLQLQGSHDGLDAIRPETLAHIHDVFSHEQALGQSRIFLDKYLHHARKKNVDSTAGAAVAALEYERGTAPGFTATSAQSPLDSHSANLQSLVAAIGPESCAEELGVKVLRSAIQDSPDNRTRFLVLASEPLGTVKQSALLPGHLGTHLEYAKRVSSRLRLLVRVFDGPDSDPGSETSSSKFQTLLAKVANDPHARIRKIERRPAPFVEASAPENSPGTPRLGVWKSAYLVELEFDGQHADEGRRRIESFIDQTSGSSSLGNDTFFTRGVETLGGWFVSVASASGSGSEKLEGNTSGN